MPRAFTTISFTPSVKAAQTRHGSREAYRSAELADDPRNEITDAEAAFLAERDSFYMATVSDGGWPYVQHRGGPAGFLKVLDARTIGFADFRGNRQYLSVGNLADNDRVSLILMDYANRRRLKLWGRARIVEEIDEPELIAQLEVPTYRARVERGIVIQVEALDWNCPQHITPRFTENELQQLLDPLVAENQALKAQLAGQANTEVAPHSLGNGPLALVISGIRQLAPNIRAYELRDPSGAALPEVKAGSYLQVPVQLPGGVLSQRNYSISSNPARRDAYEIAVQLEADGQGGSAFVHRHFALGMQLFCSLPANNFALHEDGRPAVLIAGGIGITPIKPMAQALKRGGRSYQLHYAGRSLQALAYRDRLQREFGDALSVYASDLNQRLNLKQILQDAPNDALFYVCGPGRLIDALQQTAATLGISPERIRHERFAPVQFSGDSAFQVELSKSQKLVSVQPGQTILDAVAAAGVNAPSECRSGNCGACALKVLAGTPEHRDQALSEADRNQSRLMCICVSRAQSPLLTLEL
jgi:ferredoxin-NADP reductase/predicted pyridoxine 5'-phosphate oxidase superfamily flavin-nucleotide-binding protein